MILLENNSVAFNLFKISNLLKMNVEAYGLRRRIYSDLLDCQSSAIM